jgi:glycine hydroxymethyltransferase
MRYLRRIVREHEEWRTRKTLNMISSENLASPETRYYLSTDFATRYSSRDRFYRGTRYSDEIEALSVKIAKKLYRCKFADVRPFQDTHVPLLRLCHFFILRTR